MSVRADEEVLLALLARLVVASTHAVERRRIPNPAVREEVAAAALRAAEHLDAWGFRYCRSCGCSQNDACEGGCGWAKKGLCTSCCQ